MQIKDYDTKTPDEIKKINNEKVELLTKDKETFEKQIQDL